MDNQKVGWWQERGRCSSGLQKSLPLLWINRQLAPFHSSCSYALIYVAFFRHRNVIAAWSLGGLSARKEKEKMQTSPSSMNNISKKLQCEVCSGESFCQVFSSIQYLTLFSSVSGLSSVETLCTLWKLSLFYQLSWLGARAGQYIELIKFSVYVPLSSCCLCGLLSFSPFLLLCCVPSHSHTKPLPIPLWGHSSQK